MGIPVVPVVPVCFSVTAMNSFLVLVFLPILVKIDQEMRPRECVLRTHGQWTDINTDANWFYNSFCAVCNRGPRYGEIMTGTAFPIRPA